MSNRIIVGFSGASGAIYGIRLLEELKHLGFETHAVVSRAARRTMAEETDFTIEDVEALAHVVHPVGDIGASIASGSFKTRGMIVAPCSIRTASEIAAGMTTSLLTRAADVVLKERRRLVLMVRETPLHTGHLRTLTALSEMGAVISPPMPALYARPKTIDDVIAHTVGRVLDLFDIDSTLPHRWRDPDAPQQQSTYGDDNDQD